MITIRTRAFGVTTKPTCIRAYGNRHSLKMNQNAGPEIQHSDVALALCKKMGWVGTLIEGELDNHDHVFVWSDGTYFEAK